MSSLFFSTPPRPTTAFPRVCQNKPENDGQDHRSYWLHQRYGTDSGAHLRRARRPRRHGEDRPSERANVALSALTQKNLDAVLVPRDPAEVRKRGGGQTEIDGPDGIDVLCNNAGVMGMPDVATPDGFDAQMQSNRRIFC